MQITSFHGEYRFLSNFYPSQVYLDLDLYHTVEHAYQAAKTVLDSERLTILQAPTPGQAKRLGRKVHIRPYWNDMKLSIMQNLLEQKFSEPVLMAKLKATGTAELVEGNTWGDQYWGCTLEHGRWVGMNHLGKLLMQVRRKSHLASHLSSALHFAHL